MTGTTTSFCVDSTIRDAYARDFDVLLPAEAAADTDPEAHDAVLASVDSIPRCRERRIDEIAQSFWESTS